MRLLLLLGLIIIVVVAYSVIENRYIRITEYVMGYLNDGTIVDLAGNLPEQSSDGTVLNIVQLSDLHDCRYGKDNEILFEKIKACKPDVVVLTGDMINKYQSVSQELYQLYKKLSALCPCIYSLGNHELKDRNKSSENFSEYINTVQKCGIIVSDNEIHPLQLKGVSCFFASYSSTLEQYKKRKHENSTEKSQPKLPETIPENSGVKILLSHDPELSEVYQKSGYSFIFSGHLHGGIVRIPGYRGIISTRFVLFPRYDGGCYKLDEKHRMVVSRGLGSHTIKFRLFNRPEVVHTVIHIED